MRWRAYVLLIQLLFVGGCSDPSGIPFALLADLRIYNASDQPIYVTPIGRDSRGRYYLLPVLETRGSLLRYAKQRKDFYVSPGTTVTISFDHDDCQFSGIILVSDHKGWRAVVNTVDRERTRFYYPPAEALYRISNDDLTLGTTFGKTEGGLFRVFAVK